jgi:hypothetical protein
MSRYSRSETRKKTTLVRFVVLRPILQQTGPLRNQGWYAGNASLVRFKIGIQRLEYRRCVQKRLIVGAKA